MLIGHLCPSQGESRGTNVETWWHFPVKSTLTLSLWQPGHFTRRDSSLLHPVLSCIPTFPCTSSLSFVGFHNATRKCLPVWFYPNGGKGIIKWWREHLVLEIIVKKNIVSHSVWAGKCHCLCLCQRPVFQVKTSLLCSLFNYKPQKGKTFRLTRKIIHGAN